LTEQEFRLLLVSINGIDYFGWHGALSTWLISTPTVNAAAKLRHETFTVKTIDYCDVRKAKLLPITYYLLQSVLGDHRWAS